MSNTLCGVIGRFVVGRCVRDDVVDFIQADLASGGRCVLLFATRQNAAEFCDRLSDTAFHLEPLYFDYPQLRRWLTDMKASADYVALGCHLRVLPIGYCVQLDQVHKQLLDAGEGEDDRFIDGVFCASLRLWAQRGGGT